MYQSPTSSPLAKRPANGASNAESNGQLNSELRRAFVSGHKENEDGRPIIGAN